MHFGVFLKIQKIKELFVSLIFPHQLAMLQEQHDRFYVSLPH